MNIKEIMLKVINRTPNTPFYADDGEVFNAFREGYDVAEELETFLREFLEEVSKPREEFFLSRGADVFPSISEAINAEWCTDVGDEYTLQRCEVVENMQVKITGYDNFDMPVWEKV